MKRLFLICSLLFGVGQMVSFAQSDDIYFNSSDIEKQKQEDKKRVEHEAKQRAEENENNYSSTDEDEDVNNSQSYTSYNKSYDNDGYADYNGDDYYYSSNIRRFNYPFYNMGYYSTFYNPFWYDPYWSDPYWGFSAWNRPGFSIGFGGGPYWNSYWSWYSWYGYPAYYSCWNYPYYANPYGVYYSGYWNGYDAGIYNNYVSHSTYGPRTSTNFTYNTNVRHRGFGTAQQQQNTINAGPRSGLKTAPVNDNVISRPNRNTETQASDRNINNSDRQTDINQRNIPDRNTTGNRLSEINNDRPARQQFSRDENIRFNENNQPQEANQNRRIYNQPPQQNSGPVYQAPVRQQRSEQPRMEQRYEQRSEPVRSQPRFESSPRMESPRMSSPAPRSNNGGGGGFGGRRR